MRSANTIILLFLAFAATIVPAIYEGQRNFRWGADSNLDKYAQRMNTFPDQIGNWNKIVEIPLDADARSQLQSFAAISRTYSDGVHMANVLVLFGPIGPTAVHTPDICFNSREFTSIKDRVVFPIIGKMTKSGSQFWQIDFKSKGLESQFLRNWYAWSLNGKWRASPMPRYEFADQRFLFKIQVAIAYPSTEAMDSDKSGAEFLELIEQSMRTTVFN